MLGLCGLVEMIASYRLRLSADLHPGWLRVQHLNNNTIKIVAIQPPGGHTSSFPIKTITWNDFKCSSLSKLSQRTKHKFSRESLVMLLYITYGDHTWLVAALLMGRLL